MKQKKGITILFLANRKSDLLRIKMLLLNFIKSQQILPENSIYSH